MAHGITTIVVYWMGSTVEQERLLALAGLTELRQVEYRWEVRYAARRPCVL